MPIEQGDSSVAAQGVTTSPADAVHGGPPAPQGKRRRNWRRALFMTVLAIAFASVAAVGYITIRDRSATRGELASVSAQLAATQAELTSAKVRIQQQQDCLAALEADRNDLASWAQDARQQVIDRTSAISRWGGAWVMAVDAIDRAFDDVLEAYSNSRDGLYFSASLKLSLAQPYIESATAAQTTLDAETRAIQSSGATLASRLTAITNRISAEIGCAAVAPGTP